MSDAPLLEPTAIERMRRFGGDTLVDRMAELFRRSAPDRHHAIALAILEGDLQAVRLTAHSLKSSAGNLGATRLQRLSESIEAAALLGDPEECKRLRLEIQQAIIPTIRALDDYITRMPPHP